MIGFFVPNTNIYLWIIGILVGILYFYTIPLAVLGSFILVYLIYYKYRVDVESEERWRHVVENLQLDMDAASQNIMMELPFPLIILRKDETILWYNSRFRTILGSKANILNKKYTKIFPEFDFDILTGEEEQWSEFQLRDRHYRVYTKPVTNAKDEQIFLLYWIDQSDWKELKKKYEMERPVVAYLQVDNYDEILSSTNESYRPLINAIIDQKIGSWCKEYDALVNKYEQDQYVLVFEQQHLYAMEDKKFTILDTMRETQSGNKIPITVSMGIGFSDDDISFVQRKDLAKSAMDIALARGGDQVVVRRNEKVSYFGGKTQALEKRTKTKARLKAHGIKELIENADQVFIMGHALPDIDALGAALGIYRSTMFLNKPAFMVIDDSNPSIDVLYKDMLGAGYGEMMLRGESARKKWTTDSLLVILDVHRKDLVQDVELLAKAEKVIIIDHHIRASNFIEEAVLTYIEPYASSTCELVTEVIEYIDEEIDLTELEATALLAGIHMDTKGFSFKTGVRTFEAASFLRKKGADTLKAKEYLKDDLEILVAKSEALKEIEFVEKGVALAVVENRSEKVQLIAAQTADAMLNIQGVEAAFVLAQNGEGAIISGRSYGKVNVQRILEELGGGGHMNMAGAQLPGVDPAQAKEKLIQVINKYV
ncbi:DHH family phosphoesterase [Alkalibacter rhizosphaerae]|uniref:Cyclic-di-AMP phosphodiesterase n=1 Tax=Alkalibacter rhizosphaerae TaxID=2815577 RepID=A0A975AGI1_9FIRM|nr:DHH family phosphoesterase [Alkalibacter rhizosphaerae]QSX07564.1 DHH family phosphoesterase [Alkalibacter rhizosphaerae]